MTSCGDALEWWGLYKRDYDLVTPESYAHPAKASWDLAFKILDHLKELGLLPEGAPVLDMMAGTGRFNIAACAKGYRAIGVELEEKFVAMMQANKVYAGKKLGRELDWEIIQGDARNLSGLLRERGLIGVTSPPYADSHNLGGDQATHPGMKWADGEREDRGIINRENYRHIDYGTTPGQIGNLRDGPVGITSPPYATEGQTGGLNTKPPRSDSDQHGRSPDSPSQKGAGEGYGDTEGQIGKLPDKPIVGMTSPPYSEAQEGGGIAKKGYQGPKHGPTDLVGKRSYMPETAGQSDGQIANLPDRPIVGVTSPPYEDSLTSSSQHGDSGIAAREPKLGALGRYGVASQGQIGQERGEVYLEAMAKIYSEAAKVCPVLVVVTKNPTRGGKLRDLALDTQALLEACGYKIICHHHAMLFSEQEQGHLFEGSQKKVKGRMSFFKRLSWRKGSPVAMWEDVLIAVLERVNLPLI